MSLAAVCIAGLAATACGGSSAGSVGQLKVAALVSLSGAGASIGAEQVQAMRLAIGEINAAGGIAGAKLDLVVDDSRSDPVHSAVEMRRLIVDDGVLAVLGPTLSIDAVSADPVANQLATPVLAVSNTVPGIVGRCAYPCRWIWRDSLGADRTITANAGYAARQISPVTAALLQAAPDILAASEARIAGAALSSRGVRIVGDVQLTAGAGTAGVAAAVARALRPRPELLFVTASDGRVAAQAIQLARSQGFRGQILGGDALNATSATLAAGRAGQGVHSGAGWFAGNDFPANSNFVRGFTAAYHTAPDQFAAQAYSGIEILAQAIARGNAHRAGLSIARRRSAIQNGLGKVALTTPLGPFRFTGGHDVDQIVWIVAANGRGANDLVQFCNPAC